MMMLILAHVYEIPEFNVGYYFYMQSDDEDAERKPLNPKDPDEKSYCSPNDKRRLSKEIEETEVNDQWNKGHYKKEFTMVNV